MKKASQGLEHAGVLEHFRREQGTGEGQEQLEHSEGISECWGIGAFCESGTSKEGLELPGSQSSMAQAGFFP